MTKGKDPSIKALEKEIARLKSEGAEAKDAKKQIKRLKREKKRLRKKLENKPSQPVKTHDGARCDIYEVTATHNQHHSDSVGMRVEVGCGILGLQGQSLLVFLRFFHPNGSPIRDTNNNASLADGTVGSVMSVDITKYSADWKWTFYFPYLELHLSSGTHRVKYQIQVELSNGGGVLARSTVQTFTYG